MTEIAEAMDTIEQLGEKREGKYLTFFLNAEEYGISILKVREIIEVIPITSMPRAPVFMKGVINLRGKVIPVIDLRIKFGMEEIEYDDRTCIIVVEGKIQDIDVLVGVVVDSISEVADIGMDEIDDTPMFNTDVNTDFILGLAKKGTAVKILLDIDRVLSDQEIVQVES